MILKNKLQLVGVVFALVILPFGIGYKYFSPKKIMTCVNTEFSSIEHGSSIFEFVRNSSHEVTLFAFNGKTGENHSLKFFVDNDHKSNLVLKAQGSGEQQIKLDLTKPTAIEVRKLLSGNKSERLIGHCY